MSERRRPTNLEASVRQRLLNLAKKQGDEFQFTLIRYAFERLLHRLGRSKHRDALVLKGAMLFRIWGGQFHRPTHDLDLLRRGSFDPSMADTIFRDICSESVDDDGLRFDTSTLQVSPIREDEPYTGLRFKLDCFLGVARIPLQVDIGTGDAVTPGPVEAEFPTLLDDLPPPRVRTYPRETVVAEKFQALVMLGAANTRIKDFYDLWTLARRFAFEGKTLAAAIAATFERRSTAVPAETPTSLQAEFWGTGSKWKGFLTRNRLPDEAAVEQVIALLIEFLLLPSQALRSAMPFLRHWPAGGPWQ